MGLEAGQTVAGRYRLDSPIGEGAMATVWRAEDLTLKRQVAIKFLYVRGTRDPQALVDQFLREARIAASVQHRNVIQTVDFGTVDDLQPFMVMELLSGESMGDRMEREPPLTREQVVHLVSLILRGLAAVHDAGIVHRDLKPHNVFLQRDADAVYPKILDFGISRSLQQGPDRQSAIATQEGMIVGTPDYMAPEQARGEATIDKRADIYSMGCILYEGLTGRLPFEATNIGDLIVKIVTEEPPSPIEVCPDVPAPLSAMIVQAMSKSRDNRFADARAMRRALLAAAEQALPPSRRAALSQPPPSHNNVALADTGDGVGAGLHGGPARVSASPGAPGGDATWGDFEGIGSQNMRDVGPPPGASQPRSQPAPANKQRMQASAGDALELAADPMEGRRSRERAAPDAPRGRASGAKRPARNGGAGKAAVSAADALDPLYAGADAGALELDYGPAHPAPHPAAPRRAPAASRSRAVKRVPGRDGVTPRRSLMPWLLPLVALAAVGYLMSRPSGTRVGAARAAPGLAGEVAAGATASAGATAVADSALKQMRMPMKQRRSGLKAAPAHMRDVRF